MLQLKNEVQYIMEHPDLPVTYRDIDRPRAGNVNEMLKNEGKKKEKELNAPLEAYNAVAMEVGEISKQCAYDISMRDYLLGRMEKGDTIVAGVSIGRTATAIWQVSQMRTLIM